MKPMFLTESGKNFKETASIGVFSQGLNVNSFDKLFSEAYEEMKSQDINLLTDVNQFVKNPAMQETYKEKLLSMVQEAVESDSNEYGVERAGALYAQVSQLFDNVTAGLIAESTNLGNLMPIKMMDYPLIVKQHLKVAAKDIMQTEVVANPVIKKQMKRTWVVAEGQRYEYPQCFFNGDYKKLYAAGKGFPIKNTEIAIPASALDVVATLTDVPAADRKRQKIGYNFRIVKGILAGGEAVKLDVTVDLHNGLFVGGAVNTTVRNAANTADIEVKDFITGRVDYVTNTVDVASTSGMIKKVVFDGTLSNDLNERSVSFDYTREEKEWKIEDGHRVNVPYSMEDLQDAKIMLNLDLYQDTYNDINDYLVQMEDSQVINFLDAEFEKYDGVALNPLGFNPFIDKRTFDCDSSTVTVALPSEFIARELKFLIDRTINDICDKAKIQNMTFVIYGNPRYVSLLGANVNWVNRQGQSVAGVKMDYSYGLMTSGDVSVQVVSTMKVDAVTHPGLRLIPYPIDEQQYTFKHYKHSTTVLTNANSAYRAADRPGGAMNNLMGVSRYVTTAIQGIQSQIGFANANFIK